MIGDIVIIHTNASPNYNHECVNFHEFSTNESRLYRTFSFVRKKNIANYKRATNVKDVGQDLPEVKRNLIDTIEDNNHPDKSSLWTIYPNNPGTLTRCSV